MKHLARCTEQIEHQVSGQWCSDSDTSVRATDKITKQFYTGSYFSLILS